MTIQYLSQMASLPERSVREGLKIMIVVIKSITNGATRTSVLWTSGRRRRATAGSGEIWGNRNVRGWWGNSCRRRGQGNSFIRRRGVLVRLKAIYRLSSFTFGKFEQEVFWKTFWNLIKSTVVCECEWMWLRDYDYEHWTPTRQRICSLAI